VQIERVAAVEIAADILAVEGLDAVMPGPADIATSMGTVADYGSMAQAVAESSELVRRAELAGEEAGLAWFRYCDDPTAIARAVDEGCRLIHCGNDSDLLMSAARRLLRDAHESAGTGVEVPG
jgi:4-hydroxy-2-oxoheptanedioate aldolase